MELVASYDSAWDNCSTSVTLCQDNIPGHKSKITFLLPIFSYFLASSVNQLACGSTSQNLNLMKITFQHQILVQFKIGVPCILQQLSWLYVYETRIMWGNQISIKIQISLLVSLLVTPCKTPSRHRGITRKVILQGYSRKSESNWDPNSSKFK